MSQRSEDFESMTLLDSHDYDHDLDDRRNMHEKTRNRGGPSSRLSLVVFTGLILFFLVDTICFAYVARMLLDARFLDDTDRMEFRNPYLGLDELYAQKKIKPSHYDTLINEPRFATQISDALPDKIFPVDLHRWLSDFGVLSPPDRRFKVSETVHTILQFHILDYGMEKCALSVRLPNRGDVLPHPYFLPPSGDIVRLDICEIAVVRPLKESAVSWSTRPPCVRSLGTLDAKIGGQVEMTPFSCKSGSFIGYQVSCSKSSPGCDVDVWSNHNATWGMWSSSLMCTAFGAHGHC